MEKLLLTSPPAAPVPAWPPCLEPGSSSGGFGAGHPEADAPVPLQTVKGGISETRIEKRIVITGDTEIDHDKVEVDLLDLLNLVDLVDLVDLLHQLLLLCPQLPLFHSDPPRPWLRPSRRPKSSIQTCQ